MLNFVLPCALLVAAASAAAIQDGTKLVYRGSFVPVKGEARDTRKTFDLEFVVTDVKPSGAALYWTIAEEGRGQWPWPHRFGRLELDAGGQVTAGTSPSLAYTNENGTSIVPLAVPLLAHDPPLKEGLSWQRDELRYEVSDAKSSNEGSQWNVDVFGSFGKKRTLKVEKKTGVVASLGEIVFINQGIQCDLEYRLTSAGQVKPAALPLTVTAFDSLLRLNEQLKLDKPDTELIWNAEQLETLKRELPSVSKLAAGAGGALVQIAQIAERDARDQQSRAGSVAELREKALGRKVGDFKLAGISRDQLTQDDLKGAVTVLHFWSYRDAPLKEPYGQVGYLDFLHRQQNGTKAKVIGVAVTEGLANDETLTKTTIAARKLRSFMNLSYPIYVDSGALLAKIGDPRAVDAELPLFVVVDADGKVVHYHVGHYDINPARGLEELDSVVKKHLPTDG